ncbi:MAG: hypothetical protein KGL35_22540 [Bradyrhizobium sp.]|uniref:hypothetical protein n=1 Tax=Bradyrhizobium sp. TaxID=376 RepID=UPI002391B6FB|nr:hypothetical protein [Bradyrhizobium sp.]MDE2471428.1 hypothetical protein [Bradyrhizobium sp.]
MTALLNKEDVSDAVLFQDRFVGLRKRFRGGDHFVAGDRALNGQACKADQTTDWQGAL